MSAYDENLLAAAPAVTREQMQESYSIDLLKNSSTPEVSTNAPLAPSAHGHDLDYDREAARPSAKERVSPALMASVPYERPWYRTKKWTEVQVRRRRALQLRPIQARC
ncbi:hypothetical protein BDW22DRAFT_691298 [Trametopsis cervina]|nr:hypothetical protein BDW22DRAFT_691298 [Trametopsis cervina]